MQPRVQRIALYSHDTMGLGHMRRNLLLAETLLSMSPRPVVLLIGGAREINGFAVPNGADCLSLPALYKESDASYRARNLDMSLSDIVAVRSQTIRGALEAFRPDVLLVDNVPRGAAGELDASLAALRQRGRTRFVLGLRDILDDAHHVRREWTKRAYEETIRLYFEAVWVYGDRTVYDVAREYGWSSDVAARVRYTGYLDACRTRAGRPLPLKGDLLPSLGLPEGRLALCVVGGGQDGAVMADAFASADLPADMSAVIVTGPLMSAEAQLRLQRHASSRPRLRVLSFVPEATLLMRRADSIVAMGGYNTICEIVSLGKRALIIPRVRPRTEQLMRAERMRNLGLVDMLHPDALFAGSIAEWLARRSAPALNARARIDLGGLSRVPALLHELCELPHYSSSADLDVVGREMPGATP